MRHGFAAVLTALVMVWTSGASAQTWWGNGWSFRQKIQFNNTSYDENLREFPVLVLLDSSRIDFSAVDDDGADLRFVDADGATELGYEVQQWDEAGTCLVWVNVPQVDSASAADYVWMYYGNGEAASGADAAGTWNGAYEGVWHMDDASVDEATNGDIVDATANAADGSQYGVEANDGVLGGSQLFELDGGYDYVSLPYTVLNGKSDVTSAFWLKTTKTSNFGMVSGAASGSDNEYLLWAASSSRFTFSGGDWSFASIADDVWHYVVFVRNQTDGTVSLYIDGAGDTLNPMSATLATLNTASGGLILGQDQDAVGGGFQSSQSLLGSMDELRISSVVRTDAWIGAQYASMTDGFVFWDSAAVESNPDSAAPDNDLVLAAQLVDGTNGIALAWNPGSVDSADAYQVGIWYREGTPPVTPDDSLATMWSVYTMEDSVDTVTGLPKGEYYFMATVRDSQLNVADTASAARDSAVMPNHTPAAGLGDGNALDFGGSDEYVAFNGVAGAMAGATSFTIEFWVKGDYAAQSTSYGAGLLSVNTGTGGNVILIRMDRTTGLLEFGSDYGDGIGDDEWHHVALSCDEGDVDVFIDGILEGTTTTSAAFSADDQWSLGQEWDNAATSDHLTGQLDEVRVWSTARTQAEVRNTMYRPLSGGESGLEAWFNMDHSAGDVLSDLSGNGYDGTLYNMEDGDWTNSTSWDAPGIIEDVDLVVSAGSDPDGDSLTITELTAPDNGTLAFDHGAVTVTYTPDADYNGADTFTVAITDDDGAADTVTVAVAVDAVNDQPAFTAGANDTTDEDAGARTVSAWATGISAGPADESGQTLTFTVTNDNNDLFAVQPDVDEASGDLTYEPAPDAFGEAQVVVYLADDGGTANEGVDQSAPDTFLIVVSAVADDPPVAGSGNAMDFDGSDDYVNVPDADTLDMTTSYTLEAWIYARSFNWLGGIISKYHSASSNGYTLRLCGTSPYTGISFDEMSTAIDILQADTWYHIAAVNDGGTRHLYVNGEEQTLSGTALTTAANTDPLAIGVDFLAGGRYFDGLIDEVRVWNTARSQEDVAADMSGPLDGTEAGLVAYYRCDESSGTDLPDLSGNDNTGTLMNMDDADWVDSDAWRDWDMDENDTLVVTAGYDADDDTLAITAKDAPSNGTLVMDDQKVTVSYIPDAGWFGTDTFSYYLTDTVSNDSFEVVVTVNSTNRAPVGPGDHTGLTFDGVNDYMDFDGIAADMAGDDSFCFELWMRPDLGAFPEASAYMLAVNTSGGGNTVLVGCTNGGAVMVYDGAAGGQEIASTDLAPDGEWTHVAYVLDGTTGYLYVNGVLQGSHTADYTLASNDNWSLGMELDSSTPTNEFAGDLDEVRVWNTVRTQTQIRMYMDFELAGSETGLAGYWRLNDGSGASAGDATGNGNDGTLLYDTDWITTDRPLTARWLEMNEDDTLSVSAGSDPDGDDVSCAVLIGPTNGTLVLDSTVMIATYVPDGDWNGNDSMAYVMYDPEGLLDTVAFVVVVDPVADPVTITSAAVDTAQELEFYAYQVVVDDVDGDAVVSLVSAPGWMSQSGDSALGTVPYVHERDTVFTVIAANGTYADTVTVALAIRDTNGVVPVELSSFTAVAVTGNVLLQWTTASETDNLGFNVLRSASADGPFVQVNGALIPGAGTTALPQSYSFTDADAVSGTWYYVLEQVDLGGAVSLSGVITVDAVSGMGLPADGTGNGLVPVVWYNLGGTQLPSGADAAGIYIKVIDGAAVKVWRAE